MGVSKMRRAMTSKYAYRLYKIYCKNQSLSIDELRSELEQQENIAISDSDWASILQGMRNIDSFGFPFQGDIKKSAMFRASKQLRTFSYEINEPFNFTEKTTPEALKAMLDQANKESDFIKPDMWFISTDTYNRLKKGGKL